MLALIKRTSKVLNDLNPFKDPILLPGYTSEKKVCERGYLSEDVPVAGKILVLGPRTTFCV